MIKVKHLNFVITALNEYFSVHYNQIVNGLIKILYRPKFFSRIEFPYPKRVIRRSAENLSISHLQTSYVNLLS